MTLLHVAREAEHRLRQLLDRFPAVVITGPRQVGKTTLAKRLCQASERPSSYLDLEDPGDLNKLSDPILYLGPKAGETVILDEVQRVPGLFPQLRSLIDRDRRPGRFLLLGSASPELIRDTSESLAGRVAYFELNPLMLSELQEYVSMEQHWLRGGFPESALAPDDESSFLWRQYFLTSYLERDLPLLGLRADPGLIRRLWTMLAHWSGQLLRFDTLGKSLGISGPTVRRYIDFLESSFLVRTLQPFVPNVAKRLVKSPKIYIRDTGILHALLQLSNMDELQGHPQIGASWESYVVQEIAARLPVGHELTFYRTQDGSEADLVILKGGRPQVMVEVKYSSAPRITRSFTVAGQDIQALRQVIVAPVAEPYPLNPQVTVVPPRGLSSLFR